MLDFIHDVDEFIDEENNIHMLYTTSSIQYANNSKFREKKNRISKSCLLQLVC